MLYIWLSLFALQEKTVQKELIALIVYTILVVLLLLVVVIIFYITFQKRKNKLLLDQIKQKQAYDDEISKTKLEIQEQTLKFVGRELHDNVGQLLIYAKMQLGLLNEKVDRDAQKNLQETSKIISDSLAEVRSLSKSLNSEVLLNSGFLESIKSELDRLKRLSSFTVELFVEGEIVEVSNQSHELILFRILQEFFSNTIKYSQADALKLEINYQNNQLIIIVADNGIGFDRGSVKIGSGLINMQSRANLIGATYKLDSDPGEGTRLTLNYPLI